MARRVVAGLAVLAVMGAAGCGTTQPAASVPPEPLPLPTAGIAGRPVTLYPLTLIAADPALGWADLIGERQEALQRADSLIGAFLTERSPEVNWVLPEALRQAARRAPGMLVGPDRMGTALLREPSITVIPDPLRSQMRNLTGVAGDRYALVPASLTFYATQSGSGRAELSVIMADVRNGIVGWRTIAHGEGTDPWTALWSALRTMVPDLP
ncbi:MAG: hypothetical protein GTN62_03310 [Gemmatimonadales bacterium]|nr:hypothetical protein [Gemmatimonadales bacterium]NIN49129.1 hypothetical protein [Gemmatimonadales bacterium]NIP06593.1 hypothetical protein [Gemmatimonadales bacterium]NIR00290.1 hypothetical protein [Gemmatimonadales bacterium]NIS64623.1 hypothetical protein [Gemmatimonadales bacterium]